MAYKRWDIFLDPVAKRVGQAKVSVPRPVTLFSLEVPCRIGVNSKLYLYLSHVYKSCPGIPKNKPKKKKENCLTKR